MPAMRLIGLLGLLTPWRLRPRHLPYLPLVLTVALTEVFFRVAACTGLRVNRRPPAQLEWRQGVSIIIPERGSPQMLEACLEHLGRATSRITETTEVIVVVNGSTPADYGTLQSKYPEVRWLHFAETLGFTSAVLRGLAEAREGAVYLLNNDMLLEPDALAALLPWRSPQVFAIASQIFFQESGRRREETGWTSMHFEDGLPRPQHDMPPDSTVRGTVWAGAGSAMFHGDFLRELLPGSLLFDPFYWEDTDLGARAWRLGLEVLFCPGSIAWHKHRATVQRFYNADYVTRIFERNRLLFQLRNPFPRQSFRATLFHLLRLDHATIAEIGTWKSCAALLRARWQAYRAPFRDIDYATLPVKRYYRRTGKPTVLIVSPFVMLPPTHGSAVRTVRLAASLAEQYDVILLSDELALYSEPADESDFPFASVHLVGGRPPEPPGHQVDRMARILSHSHDALVGELARLTALYRPIAVLVEHMELAGLVQAKLVHRPRFILHLHDVLLSPGVPTEASADRFESGLIRKFDGVVVCSREDQALLDVGSRLVPNGFAEDNRLPYVASRGRRSILFVGPFRAPNNWDGIRNFLMRVYPQIEAAVRGVSLQIVGGKGAREFAASEPCFARPSIQVVESVPEIRDLYEDCAMTINPQPELRGSSLKVIESVAAGRVCVSTTAGARGWLDHHFASLIAVDRVEDFVAPISRLLLDEQHRLALEAPHCVKLAGCTWTAAGNLLNAYVGEIATSPTTIL
jgi:GT2 family glycosyltransferase